MTSPYRARWRRSRYGRECTVRRGQKKSGEGVDAVRNFFEDGSIEDPPASRWLYARLDNHARDWERSHAEDAIILTAQPWPTVGWRVEMKSGYTRPPCELPDAARSMTSVFFFEK